MPFCSVAYTLYSDTKYFGKHKWDRGEIPAIGKIYVVLIIGSLTHYFAVGFEIVTLGTKPWLHLSSFFLGARLEHEDESSHVQPVLFLGYQRGLDREEAKMSSINNVVQPAQTPLERISSVPPHHENAFKWLYQDPQGKIQGPFLSAEMSEWFNAGYFSMTLLVRRGCDDKFMQLGEICFTIHCLQLDCGTVLEANQGVPELRHMGYGLTNPVKEPVSTHASENPVLKSQQEEEIRMYQQRSLYYQMMQQQMLQDQQQQLQTQTSQSQPEGFNLLSPQQQQQLLLQLLISKQLQQRSSTSALDNPGSNDMQKVLSKLAAASHPPAGLWPNIPRPEPSIWDMDNSITIRTNPAKYSSNNFKYRRAAATRRRKEAYRITVHFFSLVSFPSDSGVISTVLCKLVRTVEHGMLENISNPNIIPKQEDASSSESGICLDAEDNSLNVTESYKHPSVCLPSKNKSKRSKKSKSDKSFKYQLDDSISIKVEPEIYNAESTSHTNKRGKKRKHVKSDEDEVIDGASPILKKRHKKNINCEVEGTIIEMKTDDDKIRNSSAKKKKRKNLSNI
ncbi:GRB10-interacting GYF protein 2 [Nymphon striatum]|nr:GRB10-interacting GYF protein 2 [Nymphon striatum]